MSTSDLVERGREAFARDAWREAYEAWSAADRDTTLPAEDLERFAVAAYLVGRDTERMTLMERAHTAYLDRDEHRAAARVAFWLGMGLMDRGEPARGGGWLARAGRLLEGQAACPELGYLRVPAGLQALGAGRAEEAAASFRDAVAVGERFGDADLTALGRLGLGQSLVRLGHNEDGMALFDEAMVAVEAGEVSPVPAGIIYCAVISVCQAVFDLHRAQEWTGALAAWCDAHPDLVPYRGQCLVHRAEILELHGDWSGALAEARRASERLADPPGQPAIGAAYYRQGELHRLRGDAGEAEEAYRMASRCGHPPQPGLAQLRVAQGQPDVAAAAIRRALEEEHDPARRARLLPAAVEVSLAADDLPAARSAADELEAIARRLDVPLLRAVAAHVGGAVALAGGAAADALEPLRAAWRAWQELDAPFEAARVRVLVGLACRELGDDDGAGLELDAARATFRALGAEPELARLDELEGGAAGGAGGPGGTGDTAGLTGREVEVLRLVASGKSNRAIADELVISEHTVARHVQNIFAKLAVGSRTAAAAYAYEHHLL